MSGLVFKLRPNEELELKNCQYSLRNEGIYPVILRVYDKAKLAEFVSKTSALPQEPKPPKIK
jgi:hypothetical protein